jgi:hypothetical protein
MMAEWIPSKDADALAFMHVFAEGLTASPATYMVTSADALAVTNAVQLFATNLAICQDPATKTKVAVVNKDDARTAAEQIVRQYASLIKPNSGISDGDKTAIGVPPVNVDRNPIPAPGTAPILAIQAATAGTHTIRFADTFSPESPRRPYGVANLQLFRAVADAEVATPEEAQFYGAFSRNSVAVLFDPADNGKIATYFARWQTARGLVGPFSFPVSMAIAA